MANNSQSNLPLFREFPGLQKIAHTSIADLPTPIEKLTGIEGYLGFDGIYIKRDDLSNKQYGGNKCRKFEFVIPDALKKKRKILMTLGGYGTNHGVANTIFAKDYGLKSMVFMVDQPLTEHCRYNMKLTQAYGGEMIYTKGYGKAFLTIIWYYLTRRGSYFVWPGASRPLGSIGFVNAAFELKKQVEEGVLPEPDYLFVADGSKGTSAGLTLGCELAGLKTKIMAVAVTEEMFSSEKSVANLAFDTYKLMKKYESNLPNVTKQDLLNKLTVLTEFFGGEYGLPTDLGKEAVDLLLKYDNIHLDLTYTGKTFSGLLAFVRAFKEELKGKTILYWNTLNSVDHSAEVDAVKIEDLPEKLRKFHDGSVPLHEGYEKIKYSESDFKEKYKSLI